MNQLNDNEKDLLQPNRLSVDEWSGDNYKNAALWARTIAFIGAAFILVFLCLAVFLGKRLAIAHLIFDENYNIYLALIASIVIAVVALLIAMLMRFSDGVTTGINQQDIVSFEKGIDGLKIFFIVFGICSVLFFLLNIVTFVNVLWLN